MSMEWVRRNYGVPAKKGGRVEYTGGGGSKLGTICGASGGHIRIRLDGQAFSMPYHPTWKIRYLPGEAVSSGGAL